MRITPQPHRPSAGMVAKMDVRNIKQNVNLYLVQYNATGLCIKIVDTRNDGIPSQRMMRRASPTWFSNLTSCVKMKVYNTFNNLTNMIEKMNTKPRKHATRWARGRRRTAPRVVQRVLISTLALQAVVAHTTTTGNNIKS
jgi:hypothetical protein